MIILIKMVNGNVTYGSQKLLAKARKMLKSDTLLNTMILIFAHLF